jgi:hypothetical protein
VVSSGVCARMSRFPCDCRQSEQGSRHDRLVSGALRAGAVRDVHADPGVVRQGWPGVGCVVALDGTRICANASQSANRTHEGLCEEVERILAEAGQVDAEEDERFGQKRGGELPAGLADRRSRIERLRRCREELETEQAETQAAYEENMQWRSEWEAEHGRKLGGRRPTPLDPDAISKRKINTTDPDSRIIPRTGKEALQSYNAQTVACTGQIVLAAEPRVVSLLALLLVARSRVGGDERTSPIRRRTRAATDDPSKCPQ